MRALSVGPRGGAAAAEAEGGGGLIVVLRPSCAEIRRRPSNSEPGAAKEAERNRGEFTRTGSPEREFPGVEGYMGDEAVPPEVIMEVPNEVTGPLTSEPEEGVFAGSLECKEGPKELLLPRFPPPSAISSLQEPPPVKSPLLLHADPPASTACHHALGLAPEPPASR